MAELGKRAHIKVSRMGKWKTTVQMFAMGLLLYHDDLFNLPILQLGYGLLYIAAILTLWSMIQYLSAAFSVIDNEVQS
jgi:phosphatidylglycerophosphate synthase